MYANYLRLNLHSYSDLYTRRGSVNTFFTIRVVHHHAREIRRTRRTCAQTDIGHALQY